MKHLINILLDKKKTIVLVLMLFGTTTLQAQSNWQFGGYFAPEYSYRLLWGPYGYSGFDRTIIDGINKYEEPKLSFSTGILVSKRLNKKWGLRMGLAYMDKGRKTNGYYAGYYDWFFSYPSTPTRIPQPIRYKHHFVDLTAGFNFNLNHKKEHAISWYGYLGPMASMLIKGPRNVSLVLIDPADNTSYHYESGQPFKTILAGMEISTGCSKKLGGNKSAFLELHFKHALYARTDYRMYQLQLQLYRSLRYTDLPYSVGLKAGIMFGKSKDDTEE